MSNSMAYILGFPLLGVEVRIFV